MDMFKQMFLIKPVKGDKYAFLLFWNIFGEIHRELFFLVKNVDMFKQMFLIKPVKGDKY